MQRLRLRDMGQRIGAGIGQAGVEIACGIRRTADADRVHHDEKGAVPVHFGSTSWRINGPGAGPSPNR